MTIPAWPGDVPATARDGWQMPQMYVAPIASSMNGGNERLRSAPGSNVASITYPLQPLTLDQFASFDTFIRVTLGNGASRFTMSLVIAGSSVSKTVQLDGGKSPTITQEGQFMHVTMPLRVFGM